jgi:UDP-glucose 4-epimerase
MARILVTGGAGFIGSHLVDRLILEKHDVTVLDNLYSGVISNIHPSAKFIQGDVSDYQICCEAVYGKEYVFHLAAIPEVSESIRNPSRSNEVNVQGTINILEASLKNKVRRVIFAGSSAVYGNTNIIPTDETVPVDPLSPYALQKYAGEEYCRLFYNLHGLDTVTLRYFNVFGPRQNLHSEYSAVIPLFITAAINGKKPIIYGDGYQERDFVYVKNVVHANILAMGYQGRGMSINVGSGNSINLRELLREIWTCWGVVYPEIDYQPRRSGDVMISRANISRLQRVFSYFPAISFKDGLRETVLYYLSTIWLGQ